MITPLKFWYTQEESYEPFIKGSGFGVKLILGLSAVSTVFLGVSITNGVKQNIKKTINNTKTKTLNN